MRLIGNRMIGPYYAKFKKLEHFRREREVYIYPYIYYDDDL